MSLLGLNRNQTITVGVLLTGTLLAVLNQTLLSPALPSIMADFGVSATTAQWLTSAYSLTEAVVIPLSAFLMGRFSTRQLFIAGFTCFATGSALAAIAPNFGVLLAGRVLQALCTGMVMPMVSTVIILLFPVKKRGTAMGAIGLIIGFAPAVGPSVGGLVVDGLGWRLLFAAVAVLSVAVLALAARFLKNYGEFDRVSFDVPSVLLSSAGLVCLLYGLSSATSSTNPGLIGGLMAIGVIALALFVRRQLHLETPMLKVSILRTRRYATAVCIIVVIQAAIMGMGVILPLYIQNVRGFSATMSGLALLPGAVLGALLGLTAGNLFDRLGVRRVVIPGMALAAAGAVCLANLTADSSFWAICGSYTLLIAGLQFSMTPLNTWGLNALPNSVIQHAQSLSNTVNQVAASLGTAVLVSVSALGSSQGAQGSVAQMFAGDHLAFCAVAALLVVALAAVCVLVSDKKTSRSGVAALSARQAAEAE